MQQGGVAQGEVEFRVGQFPLYCSPGLGESRLVYRFAEDIKVAAAVVEQQAVVGQGLIQYGQSQFRKCMDKKRPAFQRFGGTLRLNIEDEILNAGNISQDKMPIFGQADFRGVLSHHVHKFLGTNAPVVV